jgi:hypothetical protein
MRLDHFTLTISCQNQRHAKPKIIKDKKLSLNVVSNSLCNYITKMAEMSSQVTQLTSPDSKEQMSENLLEN